MGSWGPGLFDDDTAMDFVDGLADLPVIDVMPELLRAIDQLASHGARDYGRSVRGLAAAALLVGRWPDRAKDWAVRAIPPPTPEIAADALRAIDAAYGDDAILTELTAEAGTLAEHLAAIEPIRQLLRAAIFPPQQESLF
ncbi:MAG: DUF4259 domain-containing protein [Micromonosporaceae bacterium]|nr:DUF4259 domain-containing protein [Micromonosporaceae bacterium]